MPLTIAHPTAVVPLRRTGLSFSPMIVGSMAPDFPYILALSTKAQYGHTWLGILWFCLPASFLVLWFFHRILRPWLERRIPRGHRAGWESVPRFEFAPMSRIPLIVASILVGAITHLIWDSFTHSYGWSVERIPVLRTHLFTLGHRHFEVCNLLQHLSTIIGLTVLAVLYGNWIRSSDLRS